MYRKASNALFLPNFKHRNYYSGIIAMGKTAQFNVYE
jgi:hypothetical protein